MMNESTVKKNDANITNALDGEIIRAGDQVAFNDKYPEFQQYVGKTFTVRNVGVVCGTPSVWLRGITGCVALDAVEITGKLLHYEEQPYNICIKLS